MFVFLTAPQNMPFSIAIVVMLMIVVLEAVSIFLGAGLSEVVDSALPEIDADVDLDVDADVDFGTDVSTFNVTKVLHWFRVGDVPVLMLFVVFLTSFGLAGLTLQAVCQMMTSFYLPGSVASVPAFLAAVPSVRFLGGLLSRYMPKDETYVISENSLIGRVATIVAGTATPGHPVQAKVKDEYGQTHYLLVEPDKVDEVFEGGEKVVLVSRVGAVYKAIESTSRALTDN